MRTIEIHFLMYTPLSSFFRVQTHCDCDKETKNRLKGVMDNEMTEVLSFLCSSENMYLRGTTGRDLVLGCKQLMSTARLIWHYEAMAHNRNPCPGTLEECLSSTCQIFPNRLALRNHVRSSWE